MADDRLTRGGRDVIETLGAALDPSGQEPYISREIRTKAMARRASATKDPSRTRGERLEARISADQKNLFLRAAELQGRTLTDFVIASVHEAAVRTIDEMQTIRLTEQESRAFAEAVVNPREPSPRLKAAARRYIDTLGR
ncbi:MAG TPA: DUF1778 domain-containing protein [Sphingomonadaceae bacterium]|nr:DUF1778 domain-containing protein [Sphingomonadaceae bacterium]